MTDVTETQVEPVPVPPEQALLERVVAALGDSVIEHGIIAGEPVVRLTREGLVPAVTRLRDDPAFLFQQLATLCGVDYPDRAERFEVVYNLLSLKHNRRIRLKVTTDEDTPVPSITGVHPPADWFEREVFDLYGVFFSDHPDLRRILTDYGFEGHPLRKDFPLTGFVEVRWNEDQKRVVYEPVQLPQDFRRFDFLSPWEALTDVQLPGDEKAVRPAYGQTPTLPPRP